MGELIAKQPAAECKGNLATRRQVLGGLLAGLTSTFLPQDAIATGQLPEKNKRKESLAYTLQPLLVSEPTSHEYFVINDMFVQKGARGEITGIDVISEGVNYSPSHSLTDEFASTDQSGNQFKPFHKGLTLQEVNGPSNPSFNYTSIARIDKTYLVGERVEDVNDYSIKLILNFVTIGEKKSILIPGSNANSIDQILPIDGTTMALVRCHNTNGLVDAMVICDTKTGSLTPLDLSIPYSTSDMAFSHFSPKDNTATFFASTTYSPSQNDENNDLVRIDVDINKGQTKFTPLNFSNENFRIETDVPPFIRKDMNGNPIEVLAIYDHLAGQFHQFQSRVLLSYDIKSGETNISPPFDQSLEYNQRPQAIWVSKDTIVVTGANESEGNFSKPFIASFLRIPEPGEGIILAALPTAGGSVNKLEQGTIMGNDVFIVKTDAAGIVVIPQNPDESIDPKHSYYTDKGLLKSTQ